VDNLVSQDVLNELIKLANVTFAKYLKFPS